jgi:hypothetical protein
MNTKYVSVANKVGTMIGRYNLESTHPNLENRINCGTFNTTCGRNKVAIITANRNPLPLNSKRPKPYAVIVAEIMVNTTFGIT